MDEHHKNTSGQSPGIPIREDTAVQVSENKETGKLEVESVKPIFRPPELKSAPVKPHWKWIWLTVVVLTVIAWAFLYWYFSNHHAPYSAPLK